MNIVEIDYVNCDTYKTVGWRMQFNQSAMVLAKTDDALRIACIGENTFKTENALWKSRQAHS